MILEREDGRGSATQRGAVCYYGVSQYDDTPRRLRRPTTHGILRPYQQAAEDVHKVGALNLNCLFKLSPPSVADRFPYYEGPRGGNQLSHLPCSVICCTPRGHAPASPVRTAVHGRIRGSITARWRPVMPLLGFRHCCGYANKWEEVKG